MQPIHQTDLPAHYEAEEDNKKTVEISIVFRVDVETSDDDAEELALDKLDDLLTDNSVFELANNIDYKEV